MFATTLAAVGILAFDGMAGILPMLSYLALNMTECQFITPALVGHSIKISPLLVFLSLILWRWLWGPVGGVVAIPLLVWTRSLAGWQLDAKTAPLRRETSERVAR